MKPVDFALCHRLGTQITMYINIVEELPRTSLKMRLELSFLRSFEIQTAQICNAAPPFLSGQMANILKPMREHS